MALIVDKNGHQQRSANLVETQLGSLLVTLCTLEVEQLHIFERQLLTQIFYHQPMQGRRIKHTVRDK